jgi:hypothetical protein
MCAWADCNRPSPLWNLGVRYVSPQTRHQKTCKSWGLERLFSGVQGGYIIFYVRSSSTSLQDVWPLDLIPSGKANMGGGRRRPPRVHPQLPPKPSVHTGRLVHGTCGTCRNGKRLCDDAAFDRRVR